MPILVIHQLGRPPRRETAEQSPIRVGRDASNTVVLEGATVSRQHLVIASTDTGAWEAQRLSGKSPLVVDGALVADRAIVREGSEILVGKEHLIVFAESRLAASEYMGATSYFARSTCARCGWSGVVSTLRRAPACPKCGGTSLRAEASGRAGGDQSTVALGVSEARAEFARIRAAKRSSLVRLEKNDAQGERHDLAEDKAIVLGGESPHPQLRGITLGTVKIAWETDGFVARSAMTFPGMRVNGVKVEASPLRPDDLIEVGANRFRFETR